MGKRKEPNRDDLLNGWLKHHNTTVEEVVKKHPKEVLESPEWFKLYAVTQEQHDEWVVWAKKYIKETTGYSKKLIERGWGFLYLDCAPSIKK
jgi:hypothetical protein